MPVWGLFALMGVGTLAILLEFFVPAFGIIGVGGVITIIVAVAMGFSEHPEPWGTLVLVTALIVTPTVIILGFKRFPKSFVGKRMILATDQSTAPHAGDSGITEGMRGTAATDLHPSGVAFLDRRRVSVVTRGEFVDRDTPVRVVTVEGARVVVERDAPQEET